MNKISLLSGSSLIFLSSALCFPVCAVLSFVQLFATRGLSMGFSRQEYWSGLPFPPPGDLPDPGIKPEFPALAGGFLTPSATWEAQVYFPRYSLI